MVSVTAAAQPTTDATVGATTGALAMASQLKAYGVEHVFGTCGHTNIALLVALQQVGIDFVIARHEQAAAHAADGYARVSGKPGVLLVHVGPGMMNAVTGVATAALDSVPLVAIAGDVPSYCTVGTRTRRSTSTPTPTRPRSTGRSSSGPGTRTGSRICPGSSSGPSGRRRRVGRAPCCSTCRWTCSPGRWPAGAATTTRSRPSRHGPTSRRTPRPGSRDALLGAERPLIYLGGGLSGQTGRDALLRLAEHLDIPIVHSLMAKGSVPDEHPLLLGMPGFWGTETTNAYTRDADVVLAIGTRFAETDASSWDPAYTWRFPPTRLIQIDIDPAEIGRNYPVEIGVVADATLAVQRIGDARAPPRAGRTVPARRARARSPPPGPRCSRAARSGDAATSSRCGPSASSPTCGRRVPADAILVTDVGWNKNGVAQCYPLPAAGRFITPGGASTMGFGPAAALGVQMAAPDRVVVALIGDGGMSAQLPAVPMAVERGLPVIFLVMNNRAHGTIADLQAANFGVSFGCEFRDPDGNPYSPDFAALGRACGADGYAVQAPGDLAAALRQAIENRRTAVIDVPMVNEPVPTPGHWNIKDIYHGVFE